MRAFTLLLAAAGLLAAENHTLTREQAIEIALRQNPDLIIARLEEQHAVERVREVRDPFVTKLVVGSGLAYTSGFPMSIEGSAPSLVQARAIQSLYNKPLSFQVAAARESARGAGFNTAATRDEVVHRIAVLHLNGQRAGRILELVEQQATSLEAIANAVRARVEDGRELPVEARAAELRLAQARQRLRALRAEREQLERQLAIALGYPPEDRVVSASSHTAPPVPVPDSETAAIQEAIGNSKDLKQIESAMHAKQLQSKGYRSSRWPQVDLVAQYALFSKFNNLQDYFNQFERHNYQFGASFQLPLFAGSATSAQAAQAELEVLRLRTQYNRSRDLLAVNTRKAYQDQLVAVEARDVARMDLDVARERLSVGLAQLEEGRASVRQVEELRSSEADKWLAFLDAQHALERARLDLLQQTGTIAAVLE
jgi:outer membrane protein TolC